MSIREWIGEKLSTSTRALADVQLLTAESWHDACGGAFMARVALPNFTPSRAAGFFRMRAAAEEITFHLLGNPRSGPVPSVRLRGANASGGAYSHR
jgi:hypothetical protein